MIEKVKNTVPCMYVISDLKDEENVGTFYGKELQKLNQKGFRAEKVAKRKGDKYVLIGKTTMVLLIVRLIKKTL